MKKILSLILALLMIVSLLAGCTSGLDENDEDEEETKESTQETTQKPTAEPTEPVDVEKEQRQLYYNYLNSSYIPQVGLAQLGQASWIHSEIRGGVESNPQYLLDNGFGGLLSAVVRDFDLDGDQDMVTFEMTALPHNETWPAIYGDSFSFLDHVISMTYFTLEDGQVVRKSTYDCAILLDGFSWGYIGISMELLEDGIYIRSYSDATDYTTYGASPTTIFHIEEDQFVFDYINGIRYGQSSLAENPNLLMGTTNIHPADYTFDSLKQSAKDTDPNGSGENRWIYWGVFGEPDGSGLMTYTGTDYTGLRAILEKGVDAFPHAPLPQGGKKPPNPVLENAKAEAQKIADHVAAQLGCVYIDIKSSYSEYSNSAYVSYETEENTFLAVSYDGNTEKISQVSIGTNHYPVPQEWQDMKDAVLQYPEFGLIAEEISPFLGKFKRFGDYMDPLQITGASIQTLQITDTSIFIKFN